MCFEYINHLCSFVLLLMGTKVSGIVSCMLLIFYCAMMIDVISLIPSFGVTGVSCVLVCLFVFSSHYVLEYLVGMEQDNIFGY